MKVEIRQADTEGEIKEICRIADIVWHETYDPLLPEGQTDYMVEKFQSYQAVRRQLEHEGYQYYTISFDGTPGGFLALVPDYKKAGELFLSKIYILSEFRGNGGVSLAMRFITEKSKDENCGTVWLTVNKYNTHAQDVYKHYGFTVTESVVSDIGNGYVMDDYIMQKSRDA